MSNDLISILPENYPNRLLLGRELYKFDFSIVNNSNSNEIYGITLSSEDLEVSIPKEFNKPFKMKGLEKKRVSVGIKPVVDGKAKLVVQINQEKKISYIEKELHPRDNIENKYVQEVLSDGSDNQIDQLLVKYKLPIISQIRESDTTTNIKQQVNNWIKAKTPEISEEKRDYINIKLIELAGAIFNSNPEYTFKILEAIEESAQKNSILKNFILGYTRLDHNSAIKKIHLINEEKVQQNLLKMIIYGIALDNKKEALSLVEKILDPEIKNQILGNLIHLYYKEDIDGSLDLVKKLRDDNLQVKIYFDMVKFLFDADKTKCKSVLEILFHNYSELSNIDLLSKSFIIFGALKTPKEVINRIENLSDVLKEKIKERLLRIIWIEEEVQKTRYEPSPILSTYFTFNSIVKSNPALEKLVQIDGNISDNLITNTLTSYLGIICLFKFNFPIYPIIERCYEEIWKEKNNSFYYLLMPLEGSSEEEIRFAEDMITQVFKKNMQMIKSTILIFNLDFIPYLSKPTIIISDSQENLLIKSIVSRVFNDSISLIVDDGLFNGGQLYDNLTRILPDTKFKVINLVMTYDFLNDYSLFRKFLGEFIK